MPTTIIPNSILENQTAILSFELEDENGDAIDAMQINTLTLTYYDLLSGSIINSRNNQNIMNANNTTVVVIPSPLKTTITWTMQTADTAILDDRHETEDRIALFLLTWDSGNRHSAKEIQFTVENLFYVP